LTICTTRAGSGSSLVVATVATASVHQVTDGDDGERDQPEGQQQHGAQGAHEVAARQRPRVGEQYRRHEQQQEELGIDLQPLEGREKRRDHADHHEEDRQRQRRHAHERSAYGHGGEEQQHQFD
jgi:hypothetical protein